MDTAVRLEAESHFDIHDTDRSGTLDFYQMVLALQEAGYSCSSGTFEELFTKVDSDDDGRITLQEWVVAYSHLKRAGVEGAAMWAQTKKQAFNDRVERQRETAVFPTPPARHWAHTGRLEVSKLWQHRSKPGAERRSIFVSTPHSEVGMVDTQPWVSVATTPRFPGAHKPLKRSPRTLVRLHPDTGAMSTRSPRWLPGAQSALMLPVTDRASLLEIGLQAKNGEKGDGPRKGSAAGMTSARGKGGGGGKNKSPQAYLQEGRKLVANTDYRAAVNVLEKGLSLLNSDRNSAATKSEVERLGRRVRARDSQGLEISRGEILTKRRFEIVEAISERVTNGAEVRSSLEHELTVAHRKAIQHALGQLEMFHLGSSTDEVLSSLYSRMVPIDVEEGHEVYCQGAIGPGADTDSMFVVDKGTLQLHRNGELEQELVEGDTFGCSAVFNAAPGPRQETVVATMPCTLYRMYRSDLVIEVERSTELKIRMRRHREEQAKRAKDAAAASAVGAKSRTPEQPSSRRRARLKKPAADDASLSGELQEFAINMGVSTIALLDFVIKHNIDKSASINDVVAVRASCMFRMLLH